MPTGTILKAKPDGGLLDMMSLFFLTFLFILLFRAALAAHGSSQAREMELQLLAYATARQDPSCVCDLNHSAWQCRILNPLSEARDQTCILMDTSQICFC